MHSFIPLTHLSFPIKIRVFCGMDVGEELEWDERLG